MVLARAGAITNAKSIGVRTGTATDRGLRTVNERRLAVNVGTAPTPLERVVLVWTVRISGVVAVIVTVGPFS